MVVELNDREQVLIHCCIGIEIKTLEIEKYKLEKKIESKYRRNQKCDKENARVDTIDDRLVELGELVKKFERKF